MKKIFNSYQQMRLFFSGKVQESDYWGKSKNHLLRKIAELLPNSEIESFLQNSCDIIREFGEYDLVWLGLWDEAKGLLRPQAIATLNPNYNHIPLLSFKNHQPSLTPEIEALQKAKPVLASVARLKKRYKEWAEVMLQCGLNNLVSFPLLVPPKVYGLLNLYSAVPRSYLDDEFSLLGEVADLVAFKIHAHQEEERRKALEEELAVHSRKLRKTMEMTIQALAVTIEMRDPYTAGHQRRVTQLASRIAQEMNLGEEEIVNIRLAGIVHDIGKIYVPVEILTKPGRLNDYEISMIRSHPRFGFDIIKETDLPKKIGEIILQHHERMDGSGYPAGLSGSEIHLESRILSVADVVEAMSSHRPYRPALGLEAALEEIDQHKGFLFDPDVVDVCLDLFEEKRFSWTRDESMSTVTH
ncbi:MAG: hypothetical protein DRI99_00925 [Candidatus Aminicenantes bacterium]|nr:MAG: hypothetical protein DRJ11_03920 [Candidatus Aminicenantes bacterium]RLE05977.1 MAG: hypothetical protein DRI99_00925 [Candidatus Aminicenantes bacterium]